MILMLKVVVETVFSWKLNSITAKNAQVKRSIDQEICTGQTEVRSPFQESGEAILSRKCQEIRLDQNHQHLASFQKVFFYRLFPANTSSP